MLGTAVCTVLSYLTLTAGDKGIKCPSASPQTVQKVAVRGATVRHDGYLVSVALPASSSCQGLVLRVAFPASSSCRGLASFEWPSRQAPLAGALCLGLNTLFLNGSKGTTEELGGHLASLAAGYCDCPCTSPGY